VEAAAPHPGTVNTMYVAASAGGTWKTTHWLSAPPIWHPHGDALPSMSFNGYHPLLVHPKQHSTVIGFLCGTGGGLLVSTNSGAQWSVLGNAPSGSFQGFEGTTGGSVAVDPVDPNIVYVAVSGGGPGGGLYITTDGGSNWINSTSSFHSGGALDVVLAPDGLYVSLIGHVSTAGIYKSTDGKNSLGSASWKLQPGLPTGKGLNAARLAAATTSGTVYVACLVTVAGNPTIARYSTTTGGSSWSPLAASPGKLEKRAWHLVIAVDPADANHVFVNDAYSLWESHDGGQTATGWTRADVYQGKVVGDDWTGMFFDAQGAAVCTADRGVYRYDFANQTWTAKQGNLEITLFYDIALDPKNPDTAYGIAQDQFNAFTFSGTTTWQDLGGFGAELGKVVVDPKNTSRIYVYNPLSPVNLVQRSDSGGQSPVTIYSTTAIQSQNYTFSQPVQRAITLDPNNHKRLLFGMTQVYVTEDATIASPTWTTISNVLSPASNVANQYITVIAVAPSDSKTIYAATADGHIWVTKDGGATNWSQADSGLFGSAGTVYCLRIDPTNANRVFAVGHASGSVWLLDPTTSTWSRVSGNLPAALTTLTVLPDWRFTPTALYLGTNRGVYHSLDLGVHWNEFGGGLPKANVGDLESVTMGIPFVTETINNIPDVLVASTAGRGAWATLTRPTFVTGVINATDGPGVVGPGDPVEGVGVVLEWNGVPLQTAITNADGRYAFAAVPPGQYMVRLIAPSGYAVHAGIAPLGLAASGGRITGVDLNLRRQDPTAQTTRPTVGGEVTWNAGESEQTTVIAGVG
jgi:hypothetical protein